MSDEPTNEVQTTPPPAEGAEDELASLRSRLEEQNRRLDEIARAYADLLNDRESFRQRVERDRDRQVEAARAEVASSLLDTIDDLRRALHSAGGDAAAVIEGVRLIAEGLERRAAALGLSPIPTVGHLFDPNLHEAVDLVQVDEESEDGKVVEEVRAGWRTGDRVVRPARVRVGRHLAQPPAGSA